MILACFNILHYKAHEETINCVDSLLKLDGIEKCVIIIYDNGSKDGSDKILRDKYAGIKNVKVCVNPDADGFSRGNNKAYKIARMMNPLFIIALNNDIVIKQKNFLTELVKLRNSDEYHMIGPDIYAPTVAEHQSPLYPEYPSIDIVEKDMEKVRERLANLDEGAEWEKNRLEKNKIKKYLPNFAISMIRIVTGNKKSDDYKKEWLNPVFSGSCVIVTDLFIKDNEVLFDPETKFYFEELIMAERCRREGYKTIYSPKVKILHMHGVATTKSFDDMKEYARFKYTNMLESYEIYRNQL